MPTTATCPKCKASLKLPPPPPRKTPVIPAVIASVVTGAVMFGAGFAFPRGSVQQDQRAETTVQPPIVEKIDNSAEIADLKATIVKLEDQLRESENRLNEAVQAIPPKPTKAELRKKDAREKWVKEMENFIFAQSTLADAELIKKCKAIQEKCDVVRNQLAKVDHGEQVDVDDFTKEELRIGQLWPFAYYVTIVEWQLYKNKPLKD